MNGHEMVLHSFQGKPDGAKPRATPNVLRSLEASRFGKFDTHHISKVVFDVKADATRHAIAAGQLADQPEGGAFYQNDVFFVEV
jgi:hypothetical protein